MWQKTLSVVVFLCLFACVKTGDPLAVQESPLAISVGAYNYTMPLDDTTTAYCQIVFRSDSTFRQWARTEKFDLGVVSGKWRQEENLLVLFDQRDDYGACKDFYYTIRNVTATSFEAMQPGRPWVLYKKG